MVSPSTTRMTVPSSDVGCAPAMLATAARRARSGRSQALRDTARMCQPCHVEPYTVNFRIQRQLTPSESAQRPLSRPRVLRPPSRIAALRLVGVILVLVFLVLGGAAAAEGGDEVGGADRGAPRAPRRIGDGAIVADDRVAVARLSREPDQHIVGLLRRPRENDLPLPPTLAR